MALPEHRVGEFSDKLSDIDRPIIVHAFPVLRLTELPAGRSALVSALANPSHYTHVLLTSPYASAVLAKCWPNAKTPQTISIYTSGPAVAEPFCRLPGVVSQYPKHNHSVDGLIELLNSAAPIAMGSNVLFPLGRKHSAAKLISWLESISANLHIIELYDSNPHPEPHWNGLNDFSIAIRNKAQGFIFLSSPEGVRALAQLAQATLPQFFDCADNVKHCRAICLGSATAEAARTYLPGMSVWHSHNYSYDGMIETMESSIE